MRHQNTVERLGGSFFYKQLTAKLLWLFSQNALSFDIWLGPKYASDDLLLLLLFFPIAVVFWGVFCLCFFCLFVSGWNSFLISFIAKFVFLIGFCEKVKPLELVQLSFVSQKETLHEKCPHGLLHLHGLTVRIFKKKIVDV